MKSTTLKAIGTVVMISFFATAAAAQQLESANPRPPHLSWEKRGPISPGEQVATLKMNNKTYYLFLNFRERRGNYADQYVLKVKRHGYHGVLKIDADMGFETQEFTPDGRGVKVKDVDIEGNDIVVRLNDNSKNRTATFRDVLTKIEHYRF